MVFNATFNNISVTSWWSILLVEETRGLGENHRSVASHWQTLSHNPVSNTIRLSGIQTHNLNYYDIQQKKKSQTRQILYIVTHINLIWVKNRLQYLYIIQFFSCNWLKPGLSIFFKSTSTSLFTGSIEY
jgi:hypothetical protein